MGLDIGRSQRVTAAGATNITDAAKSGRLLRVICEGAVSAATISDTSGVIVSFGGTDLSHEMGIAFIGQLSITKGAGGAAVTVVWG